MRKSILFACIPMIFLFRCAVLSDSQLTNIHAFATAAKNYAAFPGEVVKQSQLLHYNNEVFENSSLRDSALLMRALENAKAELKTGMSFSKKMDLSLRLIQKYAALLKQLSSDSYTDDLGENAKELGGDLNDAVALFNSQLSAKVPENIGKGISEVITIVGDRVIKNKQAKALKKFIPIGDSLIQLTAGNIVSALDADLKPLIEDYKATFQRDFEKTIWNHMERSDYNMLRFYINTNNDYDDVESLRERSIRAANKMASSHKQLKDNILRKKNLKELLSETKDFIADVKELYGILNKVSTNDQ